MVDNPDKPKHDPRTLCRNLFERSKRWGVAALSCGLCVFALGVVVILFEVIPRIAPFLIALLSVASEIFHWQSNRIKDMAETILRKLDWCDSLGWHISGDEMSDLLVRVPSSIKKRLPTSDSGYEYFASGEEVGPKRAIENVQESAWWSKHLAERSGRFCLWTTCILVASSLAILIVSIQTIRDFDTLSNIGRVVTSTIVIIFSLGLFRLTVSYYHFSREAEHVEERAKHLIGSGQIDDIQAIKLGYEYQLSRATAPLIPTWVWKSKRADLNELWREYRLQSRRSDVPDPAPQK
jgi:predicted PurR-regulated permease PerM